MESYLADWLEFGHQVREQQRQNPFPAVMHLRRLREEAEESGLTVEQYVKQQQIGMEVAEKSAWRQADTFPASSQQSGQAAQSIYGWNA